MKEQYIGDINDYRKYALLRALADGGRVKVGVCWMLTPADGGRDGRKLGYLSDPRKCRRHDPVVFDAMGRIALDPVNRRIADVEQSGIIPSAMFFNELLDDSRTGRADYFARCRSVLGGCDLVFFDPDNGLEIKKPAKGNKNSSKFLFLDEVADFYNAGRSILIYQHYPHIPRTRFLDDCAERLTRCCPGAEIIAFVTGHVAFLLAAQPSHLMQHAWLSKLRTWDKNFIDMRPLN